MTDKKDKNIEPIKGKVSSILTERELAINIGMNKGVEIDMKFKVLADKPLEVNDPETDEILGYVDREKVKVQVTEVYDKFSICKTYRTIQVSGKGLFPDFTGLFTRYTPPRLEPETLKAEDSSLPPPLTEEESYVKKGDRVIQIFGDD